METLQEWLARTAKNRQKACRAELLALATQQKQAAKAAAWWAAFKAKQARKEQSNDRSE